ncbi:MAG: helix-turn-helix domain-containing protein, partial [Sphaerospermopsis kisseleviana]
MANKEDKARIWQLLDKGIGIGEIEKTTKTPRRTLYRWYAEWRENRDKARPTPVIGEVVTETRNQTESQLEVDFKDDWCN